MMVTVKKSDNQDGSDAELDDGFDDAEQNEVEHEERNDNGNPENSHPAPVDNIGLNGHKSDYAADHDDEEDDLEELSDLLNNAPSRSIHPRVSILPIITRDEAGEIDADGELATPITPTPQVANVARRRGLSREQSSSLDTLSDEGNFASIEEQLFQNKRSIFLDYERLKASIKMVNETTENFVKRLKEENAACAEKAKQVLLNLNASYEDIQPALDRIGYRVGNNNKKRKIREDDNEQIERLAVELENPGMQAFLKNGSR